MSKSRIVHVLQNPLDCLSYVKSIIDNKLGNYVVVLPEFIDPVNFESLLLNDKDYIAGVEIFGISSLPEILLKKAGLFNFFKERSRVDLIFLSELFAEKRTRGVTRLLLSTISELKHSFFEIDYLFDIFENSQDETKKQLLEAYNEYNEILELNNFYDEADLFKKIFEQLSNPLNSSKIFEENTTYIFAGFTEFLSKHLILIESIAKKIDNCFVVTPDIFAADTDYSRILSESFISMNFDIKKIECNKTLQQERLSFDSRNSEAKHISNVVKGKNVSIFVPSNFELYNSLFKYYLGDDLRVQSASRLDKSQILSIVTYILKSRSKAFSYNDFIKVLSYSHLWENHEQILALLAYLNEKALFPCGIDGWKKLSLIEEHKEAVTQLAAFIDYLVEILPLKTNPVIYANSINQIFSKIINKKLLLIKEETELSTVFNLAFRVAEAVRDRHNEVSLKVFCEKLYIHAEENYMINPVSKVLPYILSPIRLITSNINDLVWFVGMSDEAVASLLRNDPVFDDALFLSLRNHGLVKPTNKEAYKNQCSILKNAFSFSNIAFCHSDGNLSKLVTNKSNIQHYKNEACVFNNSFSELFPDKVDIKNIKIESISATDLDLCIQCPYKYFAGRVLKIKDVYADDLVVSAFVEGSILHECLEKTIVDKIKGKKVNVLQTLKDIVSKFENSFKLNVSPLNQVMIQKIERIITNVLDTEKEFFESCKTLDVFCTEKDFKCYIDVSKDNVININNQNKGILLKVKVDRIDLDTEKKRLLVVDYKRTKTPTSTEIAEGSKIQIPLYALVVSLHYPEYECAGGCYINLKDNKRASRVFMNSVSEPFITSQTNKWSIIIDDENFNNELSKLISQKAAIALNNINSSSFNPKPDNLDLCKTCEFKGGCCVMY